MLFYARLVNRTTKTFTQIDGSLRAVSLIEDKEKESAFSLAIRPGMASFIIGHQLWEHNDKHLDVPATCILMTPKGICVDLIDSCEIIPECFFKQYGKQPTVITKFIPISELSPLTISEALI